MILLCHIPLFTICFIYVYIYIYIHVKYIYIYLYLSFYLSIYLSTYLSIYLATYLPTCLPACLPSYLPIYAYIMIYRTQSERRQIQVSLLSYYSVKGTTAFLTIFKFFSLHCVCLIDYNRGFSNSQRSFSLVQYVQFLTFTHWFPSRVAIFLLYIYICIITRTTRSLSF